VTKNWWKKISGFGAYCSPPAYGGCFWSQGSFAEFECFGRGLWRLEGDGLVVVVIGCMIIVLGRHSFSWLERI